MNYIYYLSDVSMAIKSLGILGSLISTCGTAYWYLTLQEQNRIGEYVEQTKRSFIAWLVILLVMLVLAIFVPNRDTILKMAGLL